MRIPGEETKALGEKCQQYGFYLAGTAFEKVDEFPNHFFNTGFIISPEGEVILKYRKVNSSNNNLEISTSPVDVQKKYGPKELFPVVKTPIGNLGMFICYDGWFPEVARCLMINGAEVMLRPMGAAGLPTVLERDWWVWQNRSRAYENLAYVLGANWADSPDSEYGSSSSGNSMIVDYRGNVVAQHTDASEWFVIGRDRRRGITAWPKPGLHELHRPAPHGGLRQRVSGQDVLPAEHVPRKEQADPG